MKCDFSLRHYGEIIQLAKENGYTFARLRDWYDLMDKDDRIIFCRHDIDFSLEYAQEMCLFETQHNITSTYHIMLQSHFYNALVPENVKIIRYISDLNFEIGYHIDSNHMLQGEHKLLEHITGKTVNSYSRHFPLVSPRLKLSGRLKDAMDIKIKYLSDSCRNWREDCLCQNLGKYDRMQVLMHPIWYVTNTNSRIEAIAKLKQDLRLDIDNHIHAFHAQVPEYLESITNHITT